jgi:hypothetical protein
MADTAANASARCGRCGQQVVVRGGRPALYCAVCGQRLAPLSGNVEHRFEPAPNVEHRFQGRPVPAWFDGFAVVFGLLALLPGCGLVFAALALILAFSAGRRTDDAGRRVGMSAAAQVAVMLAALGLLLQYSCVIGRGMPAPRF